MRTQTTGPIEREPLTLHGMQAASRFTLTRFIGGCARLFRPYLMLGVWLTLVYVVSGAAYCRVRGLRLPRCGRGLPLRRLGISRCARDPCARAVDLARESRVPAAAAGRGRRGRRGGGWPARSSGGSRARACGRSASCSVVVLTLVVGATFVSALAWSGVGLIAFVPLVGLAVFPLQMAALLLRGLLFEYISLTALGAYLTLYRPPPGTGATAWSDSAGAQSWATPADRSSASTP